MNQDIDYDEWIAEREKGEDRIYLKLRDAILDIFKEENDGGEFILSYCIPEIIRFRQALLDAWLK